MNIIKDAKRFVRMENIGYGVYDQLALFNKRKNPQLANRYKKIAKDEFNHGRMFKTYLKNKYNINSKISIWIFLGRLSAFFFSLKSKENYVKFLSDKENDAVIRIKQIINSGKLENSPYLKCYKAILNDEIDHSKVYAEFYP